MTEINARDAKLVQYLNEAYGNERKLETALQAHIAMTTRAPYKKRLQEHLRETKAHARDVQRRIKQLGGTAEQVDSGPLPDAVTDVATAVQSTVRKGAALAEGSLHALRGTGEQEKQLKNAKTEYANEAEEIATYTSIEALGEAVRDRETATLARRIRREEERMASFLAGLIPQLTKAVATSEIPAALRRSGAARTASKRSASTRAGSAKRASAKPRAGTAKRGTAGKRAGTAKRGTAAKRGGTAAKRGTSPRRRGGSR